MNYLDYAKIAPEFVSCYVCWNPRDIYENVDGIMVVEQCSECGNEHYAYIFQKGGLFCPTTNEADFGNRPAKSADTDKTQSGLS